jgi:hypothetical protein
VIFRTAGDATRDGLPDFRGITKSADMPFSMSRETRPLPLDDAARHALPLDAARELLVNRCFVRYPRDTGEELPYDWRLAVRAAGSTWPLMDSQVVPFGERFK